MTDMALLAFALATGTTIAGLSATIAETVSGEPASFAARRVSAHGMLRTAAMTVLAGPVMLFADALAARRNGSIGMLALAGCGLTALVWALALGVVTVEVAALASRPLPSLDGF